MTKTITVYLSSAITFNGAIVDAGEVIVLPEKSANALIAEGGAEAVDPSDGGESFTSGETGKEDTKVPEDPKTPPADEKALKTKALDDKYKGLIPELKEHAKEADVEFAHDATKAAIIEAIIEAGKAEAVLEK